MGIFRALKQKVTCSTRVIMTFINRHTQAVSYAGWELQLSGHEMYIGRGHNLRYLFLPWSPTFRKPGYLSWYNDQAMGWTNEEMQFDSRHRQEILLVSKISRPAVRSTQPPIQCVTWRRLSPQPVKQPGREADCSPAFSTGVKNEWSYIFSPHTPSWSAY